MNPTTRTAPRNARFSRPSASHLATVDNMLARAAALGNGGRMTALASDIAPPPSGPTPTQGDVPNTSPDANTRLDQHAAQLTDHEMRLDRIEKQMPEPGFDEGDANIPASAAAARPPAQSVDSRAIYARMNARPGGLRVATPAIPAVIQTSAGPVLDTRAMYARLNAAAVTRGQRGP